MSDQPASQLKFEWDLPDEEGISALSAEEIQRRKDVAEAFIRDEKNWQRDEHGNPVKPFWMDHAEKLHYGNMRFPFRAAVYTAWLCTPRKYRFPKTQKELADLLGLSSDRQFTVWMAKNPQILEEVRSMWRERAMDRLSDSMEAMFTVAATEDYKGRGDRELHFKLAGVLQDSLKIDGSLGDADDALKGVPYLKLLRMAGITDPEKYAEFKAKLEAEYQEPSTGDAPGEADEDKHESE